MAKGPMGAELIFNPSYYKKLGLNGQWEDFFSEVLDFLILKAEEFCKASPEDGGAPVDKGFLSASTSSDLSEKLAKYLTNGMEYWIYVVYGTSKQKANNFPQRAYQKIISENWVQLIVNQKIKERGI